MRRTPDRCSSPHVAFSVAKDLSMELARIGRVVGVAVLQLALPGVCGAQTTMRASARVRFQADRLMRKNECVTVTTRAGMGGRHSRWLRCAEVPIDRSQER